MTRRRDVSIAVALLLAPIAPLAVGAVLNYWWLVGVGILGVTLVAPVSYKLVKFPPGRTISVGTFTRDARRAKRGWLSGGMVVSLSGIDGSGKSSTGRHIIEHFEEDFNITASIVWGRWRPLVSYPVMGAFYVLRGWRRKDYDQSRLLKRVWAYLVLADLLAYAAVYIWPRLLRGEVVCVDRYILDTVVELRFDGLYNEHAIALMNRLLPTPDIAFWFDVPHSTAIERKEDTQEMLNRLGVDIDAETYLEKRRALYDAEHESFDAIRIDTTRPFEETTTAVAERAVDSYFHF